MTGKRLVKVRIDNDNLTRLLRGEAVLLTKLPADVRVTRMYEIYPDVINPGTTQLNDTVMVVLESKEFEELAPGALIPEVYLTYHLTEAMRK